MDELGYQHLLSKCIQNGLPGGGFSKSSSALQKKAGPAVGGARLLENSMSGSREDTSGAAEGPPAESVSGHRVATGMDGTAIDKRRSPSIATPKNAGTAYMRGTALLSEGLKIDGFPRSFLKSRRTVCTTPQSTFSFKSLLEGAISACGVKPPTSVQKLAEPGMRSAPRVEPQKDHVSGENYPFSDERLVGERLGVVVSGRSTPQSRHDEKVLSVEEMAKAWKGEGDFALCVRDSGSLSGVTVGDGGPHISYSSLLQAQLGDDIDEVRTETPQKTAEASLVDMEVHSSLLNLQSRSIEVEGGLLPLFEKTSPLLPPVARRASFIAADSVSIDEQIPDVHHSDKPSHASAGAKARSADKVSERDLSEPLRATAVPASSVLNIVEEDVLRAEVVVERGNSSLADLMCKDKETSDFQLREVDDTAFAGYVSRSADILSERGAIDSSEAAEAPASAGPRRIVEHVSPAEVVGHQGRFVVADSACIDEMSDVQLLEELSRALAADESQFAEKVLNGDAIDSPEAAAVSASILPTNREENDARALVAVDRSSLWVADTLSTDERTLNAQLSEEPIGTFGTDESRPADNALYRDILELSEATAAGVPGSLVFTRIEEADISAGLESASCVVAASTCGDDNVSSVQVPEGLSRDFTLDESQSAEIVAERDVIYSSEAAAVAVSPLPYITEGNVSRVESVVAGLMENGEKISNVVISGEPSHALTLDGSRSACEVFIGSSEGVGDSASPVPIITGKDVSMLEVFVEKQVVRCGDAVVNTGQGITTLRSFNPSDVKVLERKIQCPSQCLVNVKDRLQGQADHVLAGTTLDLAFQASHKESVSETENIVSSEVVVVSLSVERDLLLRKVLVDGLAGACCDQNLRSEGLRHTGTVVECSRQVALKQTENDTVLFVEKHRDEMCDARLSFPRGNVPLKSNSDFIVAEVVLESELDTSKGELVQFIRTEEVINDLNSNSLVEKFSSTLIPPCNGYFVRDEPHPTPEHSGSRSFCSENLSEPIDAVSVLGSSLQAGTKPTEDINSMVGRDQENSSCHRQVMEDFMGRGARATEEHLMGVDYGCGPQRSCVGSVEISSTRLSPPDNGNLADVGHIHTHGRHQMISLTDDKVKQDHLLERPASSSEVTKRSEVKQYIALPLLDEAPEMQIVVSQFSESRTDNMGLVFFRTGHESDEFPSSWLPRVEAGMRNEVERVPESHVGEIVNGGTDSGNFVDLADQVLRAEPDAISEGLRQVFLRDSDATISDSLESAQGTGAELIAGREVQSPLVTKSKDRHARHLDDLEDSHIGHLEGLGNPPTRHCVDLDGNEQPYASPFSGTVHDQFVGSEVRPYKKKARPRAYNHEKAIQGTGRSHLRYLGSKRISQLQNPGNRCRRNRHIYPDQPVPVFIEGRDEGFEEADGGSFLRWLAHEDEANAAPAQSLGKRVRTHGQELVKSMIAIPSFRVVSDYEEKQQEVEKRRKLRMQLQPIASFRSTFVSSSTVKPSEYDMDDEDGRWLHAWNKRLARSGLKQPLSEDKFEEMIEYFERSAEMILSADGVCSGFPHCGKSLAQPLAGGSLSRTCPSGLGILSTNSASSGTPVLGNPPMLNPPAVRPGHPPWTGGLKDVLSSGKEAMVSSSIRADSIGRNSASPASVVPFHTLTSENERKRTSSDVDAVCRRPSEGSLRKSFEPSALEKLSDDCCICNGGEDDENNPVYTCKRCLIHVHQSCYGIREKFRDDEGRVIAPSNWCCRKCEAVAVGRAQPNVSCALCRKRGGALKPTVVAQKWAHVACALYTNETFFVDPDAMEPIDGIAAVTARAQERQERCGLCGVKKGICSLCAVKNCRAPFHISCGVSQGASFELRQSKQKVVAVRSFCPRHARTTAMDSVPSAELKDRHMLSCSSTSWATASATASGSISTASSMDDREEWSSRQSISHLDGSFGEPAGLAKNVGIDVTDLTDNVMIGKGVEDAGRVWSKGSRFTLKRRWDESCDQASEVGLSSDCQKKSGEGTGVTVGKLEARGCKSTWQVLEPRPKLKKIKFKFGRLAQNLDLESSPTLVYHEMIGSKVPQAEKMKDVMPAVGEKFGDGGVNERDAEFLKGVLGDRFAKEVKELMILEDAMKSGVAPGHIIREAFVYWRAKRAESKGSLLCELHHEQWLRSQGIFNKDANDEERVATGKIVSFLRVPEAQQPSLMSNEKTLEVAKEIRMQLEQVLFMAQMVVQREKLKYNHQFLLGSIASAELNRAEGTSEERHCVWCPSVKTLLKCGTCPRSFCFNCFKHRKGFGVKGWMAAMKQPMYICKYCRELSSELADLSNDVDPAPKNIGDGGAVSTPGNTSGHAIEVVGSTPVITSEAVLGVVSTSVTSSKHVGEGRGNGVVKGRDKGRSWDCPGSGSLKGAEDVVMATVSSIVDVTEGREKSLEIGHGKENSWTASENAMHGSPRRGSEGWGRNLSKPSHLEDGLNKFLTNAHNRMEHSSFETTLRRLKILRCTNTDPHKEVVTFSDEIPSGVIAAGPGREGATPSTSIGGNVSVPSSPGSGPALLVYKKKRRLILGESSESPPSAYDFGNQPCSSTGLENGSSVYKIMSPRRLADGVGAAND